MLGCHPQMYGLAEINLFARDTVGALQDLYRARDRSQHGLLRSLSELAFQEQTAETVEAVRGWLNDNADMSTPELFRTMQEWAGERGLIDKSPLHVYTPEALDRIGRAFPEARFLHLTRHPGDMVKSVFELRGKLGETARARFAGAPQRLEERVNPNAPDKMWLEPNLVILEFLESVAPRQQMRLRGEDLLADPRRYLSQTAEWLDIGTEEADIEGMLHPENSPFAAYGPENARYGLDPNFMERPHLRPFIYKPHPLVWENPSGETIPLSETMQAYAMIFGY